MERDSSVEVVDMSLETDLLAGYLKTLQAEVKQLQDMVADLIGVPATLLFSRHYPVAGQRRLDEDYGEDE